MTSGQAILALVRDPKLRKDYETAQRMALADHQQDSLEQDADNRDESSETRETDQYIEALEWHEQLENREQESE